MDKIKQYSREEISFEIAKLKHLKKELIKLDNGQKPFKLSTKKDVFEKIDNEIDYFTKLYKDTNG